MSVASEARQRLIPVLTAVPRRVVACSGGVDSLVLAAIAVDLRPTATVVAHTQSPAVPVGDTMRVESAALERGWDLRLIRSGEFEDDQYLRNPVDRCYFCKTHLYEALDKLTAEFDLDAVILSGANVDDLGEFRPGLRAATEHNVRHPFVDAGIGKAEIRALAEDLDIDWAELPASPCLSSRLYTGTAVTPSRLAAVAAGEATVRRLADVAVIRCRLRADEVLLEVPDPDRALITPEILEDVLAIMRAEEPGLAGICLDEAPYRPGRSFVELGRSRSA